MAKKPKIFDYTSYRAYLGDRLAYLAEVRSISKRQVTLAAKFGSTSYINMVLDGRRGLTESSGSDLADAIGLRDREKAYWLLLVAFEDEKSSSVKTELFEKMKAFREFQLSQPFQVAYYELFSNWYIPTIFEAFGNLIDRLKPDELAQKFGIRDYQAKKALKTLEKLGFIKKSGKAYVKGEANIATPQQTTDILMAKYHREMMQQASRAMDEVDEDDREMGGMTMALDEESLQDFKEEFYTFRMEFMKRHKNRQRPSGVYHLGFQFFPLFKAPASED